MDINGIITTLWILTWYLQVMLFLFWNSTMKNRDYKENTDIKIIVVMALLVSFFMPPWTYPLYYGLAQCLHTVGRVYFSAFWFCLWVCDFFLPIEWGGHDSEPVLILGTKRSLRFYLFSFTFAITIGRTCFANSLVPRGRWNTSGTEPAPVEPSPDQQSPSWP